MHFHLAPLRARREIALLGIIHRAALRQGPPHFHQFFIRARAIYGHTRTIYDPCVGRSQLYFRRSIFGLVAFYNRLPEEVIQLTEINAFQRCLQNTLRMAVEVNVPNWHLIFRSV